MRAKPVKEFIRILRVSQGHLPSNLHGEVHDLTEPVQQRSGVPLVDPEDPSLSLPILEWPVPVRAHPAHILQQQVESARRIIMVRSLT